MLKFQVGVQNEINLYKWRKRAISVISNQKGEQINHGWTKLIRYIMTLTWIIATTSFLIIHSMTKGGVTSKWQKVLGLLGRNEEEITIKTSSY
jgi:hypothetical protein